MADPSTPSKGGTKNNSNSNAQRVELVGLRGKELLRGDRWTSCVVIKDNRDGTIDVKCDENKSITPNIPAENFSVPWKDFQAKQAESKTPNKESKSSETEVDKFAMYGLSPPPKFRHNVHPLNFDSSISKINREVKKEWEQGGDDAKKIILFLYSRGFRSNYARTERVRETKKMLDTRYKARDRILQVLDSFGDKDKAKTRRKHYAITCMTLHRYFQQRGAVRFCAAVLVTYYLRGQIFNSCFVQAVVVTISYILQAWEEEKKPPPDASQFIRRNLSDDQLVEYVANDSGGDSIWAFKLLERQFFECQKGTYPTTMIDAEDLKEPSVGSGCCNVLRGWLSSRRSVEGPRACLIQKLKDGPGLVAKFKVPKNFHVENHEAGPGYARFTVWGEPAKWVALKKPWHKKKRQEEVELKESWKTECESSDPVLKSKSSEDATRGTASRSPTPTSFGPVRRFHFDDKELEAAIVEEELKVDGEGDDDASDSDDDDDDDNCDETSSCESQHDSETNEQVGHPEQVYHAMVLLGSRTIRNEVFWLIQNSWGAGGMRILEMSSAYLAESGAEIVFLSKKSRKLRDKPASDIQFCSSPVAESGLPERSDCVSWDESLLDFSVKEIGSHDDQSF